MKEKINCPWCNEEVEYNEGTYKSSYGDVIERRCSKCGNLVSTRLKGIPQDIIKKNAGVK